MPARYAARLPVSYVKSFLDEDMHMADDQKRDPGKMVRLMRSYARNMEQAAAPKILICDMTTDAASELLSGRDRGGPLRRVTEHLPVGGNPPLGAGHPLTRPHQQETHIPLCRFFAPGGDFGAYPGHAHGGFEIFGLLFESLGLWE